MLEKDIVKKIIDYANGCDGIYVRKRFSSMNTNGEPDITGSIDLNSLIPFSKSHRILLCNGYSPAIRLEIEVKRPGKHPTKLQAHRLKFWTETGAITGCAHSIEEFKQIISEYGYPA